MYEIKNIQDLKWDGKAPIKNSISERILNDKATDL